MNLLMVFLGIVLVQAPAASSSLSVSYGDKAARMSVEDLARLPAGQNGGALPQRRRRV